MPYIFGILFIFLTIFMYSYPKITVWDKNIIIFVQNLISNIPVFIFTLPDCILYTFMIIMPIIGFGFYFIKNKKWLDLVIILSTPFAAFLLNCIIKPIMQRPRPPYELQTIIHPQSFSYVSSHSLVTICLWGMVIFYINKYCPKKRVKIIITAIAILWILFVGLSRIALGVHYPSDVLGAWVLGLTLIFSLIKLKNIL